MRPSARLLLGAALLSVTAGAPAASPSHDLTLTDLSGRAVPFISSDHAGGAVFVFIRTDCPISDRYLPELEREQRRATADGIDFALVFVDPGEASDAIADHLRAFNYTGRVLRDDHHSLVRLAGAETTPEAIAFAVEQDGPRLVYRGRIDNRYEDVGRMRPAATDHDLADIVDALAGKGRLTLRTTKAVGCAIADLR